MIVRVRECRSRCHNQQLVQYVGNLGNVGKVGKSTNRIGFVMGESDDSVIKLLFLPPIRISFDIYISSLRLVLT